jgi:hypothetical protein
MSRSPHIGVPIALAMPAFKADNGNGATFSKLMPCTAHWNDRHRQLLVAKEIKCRDIFSTS